ncbi:PREDICTED: uncharacterized protein LOC101372476, partial [Odobenus rosmarus divergens]|uniref:Uncharacterized protein LOC101372476 n=1 Tax=Odobenus rosmarus divergens TaxID=9708 RepID=A0A2U3X4Y0_ODORO
MPLCRYQSAAKVSTGLTATSVLEASRIRAQGTASVRTAWMAMGRAFAKMASKAPSVSSALIPINTDLGVTKNVCAFPEHAITGSTVTGPAWPAHAEKALRGGSATSRPPPVGPTYSSVTSTPPVNTAMGQQ